VRGEREARFFLFGHGLLLFSDGSKFLRWIATGAGRTPCGSSTKGCSLWHRLSGMESSTRPAAAITGLLSCPPVARTLCTYHCFFVSCKKPFFSPFSPIEARPSDPFLPRGFWLQKPSGSLFVAERRAFLERRPLPIWRRPFFLGPRSRSSLSRPPLQGRDPSLSIGLSRGSPPCFSLYHIPLPLDSTNSCLEQEDDESRERCHFLLRRPLAIGPERNTPS